MKVDIASNRRRTEYTSLTMAARVAWGMSRFLFRYSPRTLFEWRNIILRCFGAKVGLHVHVYNSARIYMPWNLEIGDWSSIGEEALIYNLGKITIGRSSTISHRAHLCAGTHDYEDPTLPLLKQPIEIGDQAWICADAFIGPGVRVGEGAIVGARAVVMKDVPPWKIVAGNPARIIKERQIVQQESL